MLARLFMILTVMVFVSACSSTKEDETLISDQVTAERQDITNGGGPLSEIYDGEQISSASTNGAAPGTQQDLVVNVGDRVFFGSDRYDVNPESRRVLEKQANWLAQYPNLNITVAGHADERGTREYNLALGERRANSVKNYLAALGVDPRRIDTLTYGKERPSVVGNNQNAWSQNRRGVSSVR